MRTMSSIVLLTMSLLFTISCNKDTATICENLLEQGIANSFSLKGEWEFEYFAYTVDGSKIKNKEAIQKGYISITDTGSVWFYHTNTIHFSYTLDNSNGIFLTLLWSTEINPRQEEISILDALKNSLCFVIKNDELLIHYKEADKKNIIILSKK